MKKPAVTVEFVFNGIKDYKTDFFNTEEEANKRADYYKNDLSVISVQIIKA